MAEPAFLGNRCNGVGRDFCASRLEKQLLARAFDLVLAAAPNSRKLGRPPCARRSRGPAINATTIEKGVSS